MRMIALCVCASLVVPAAAIAADIPTLTAPQGSCPPTPEPFKSWYIERYPHGDPDGRSWAGMRGEETNAVLARLADALAVYVDYATGLMLDCDAARRQAAPR